MDSSAKLAPSLPINENEGPIRQNYLGGNFRVAIDSRHSHSIVRYSKVADGLRDRLARTLAQVVYPFFEPPLEELLRLQERRGQVRPGGNF